MARKRPYVAPKLVKLGTVADLTHQGQTNPGTDMRGGSVNPPGQS